MTEYSEEVKVESRAIILHSYGIENNIIATYHEAEQQDGKLILGPGINMSASHQVMIGQMLIKEKASVLEVFPENLIAKTVDSMVFFSPGSIQTLRFYTSDKETKSLKCCIPPMVYLIKHGNLWMAALKENVKPNKNTALYHAPFPNMYPSTWMCVGDNPVPRYPELSDIEETEKMFFNTEFTHGYNDESTDFENSLTGYIEFWEKNGKEKEFDGGTLKPIKSDSEKMTLEEWVNLERRKVM